MIRSQNDDRATDDEASAEPSFGVILPRADRELLEPGLKRFRLPTYELEELLANSVLQYDEAGRPTSVESPTILLGALFNSKPGMDALSGAAEALELLCGLLGYEECRLVSANDGALGDWVARRMTAAASILTRDCANLRRALSIIRMENEDLLNKFAALESAAASSTPRRVRKLKYPPTRTSVTLSGAPENTAVFSQRLPVSANGLAAVVLDVQREAHGPAATLKVELRVGRQPDVLKTWRIATAEVSTGPLPLWLEHALARTALDATLSLQLVGAPGSGLRLSLSFPTPLTDYGLVTPSRLPTGAPLAVEVWGSAPGLKVVEVVDDPWAGESEGSARTTKPPPIPSVRHPLFADELACVARIGGVAPVSFNVVEFRPHEGDVLVHPVDGETTVALIPDLAHRDIQSLSAVVVVDNAASAPVEFGLAIVPRQSFYNEPESLIRHWTRVEPLIFSEVLGDVLTRPGEFGDLLIATRMAEGASADLAWAYIKRVEIMT